MQFPVLETLHLASLQDSVAAIALAPNATYGYSERKLSQQFNMQTIGGRAYSVAFSGFSMEYTIPMTLVNSQNRALLHRWWRLDHNLWLTFNNSYSSVESRFGQYVNWLNTQPPLQQPEKPYFNRWSGVLQIKSSRFGLAFALTALTLDSPDFGALDNWRLL